MLFLCDLQLVKKADMVVGFVECLWVTLNSLSLGYSA